MRDRSTDCDERFGLASIDPVRLSTEVEAELDGLGTVRHVVRLGYYHGLDDPYYVGRYGAEFWCQDGSSHYAAPAPGRHLGPETPLPIDDAELFVFRETK